VRRLGVNIDHIATLRNARGELHPDPIFAAKFVKKAGADSITIHLREDRRHIKDNDAKKICSLKKILVNLEISTNSKMISKALKIKPNFICLVPENRKEITTEGGLDLKKNKNKIKKIISKFKRKGIHLIKSRIDRNNRFDIKLILKKLHNYGCRNLLIEGGDKLTNSLIKNKIFNKFYLFKSPKNLSKNSEYLKFSGLNTLNQKYQTKINLNLNLRKDRITLYR